jgi:hypothetical protein
VALLVLAGLVHEGAAAGSRPGPSDRRRSEASAERARLSTVPRPAWRSTPWRRAAPEEIPAERPAGRRAPAPRGYLIYLIDGGDPIVVSRYVEENGQLLFEKYGGWVRIPTYEVLKVVPDTPDPANRTANLPPPPVSADTGEAPLRTPADLFVTMRGGSNLRVVGFTPDGEQVRVAMPDGSFTVPRSEIVSVVRVPPDSEVPEAWLSVLVTETDGAGSPASSGLVPAQPDPRLPYSNSDRPHFVRLANGQLMRVDGFTVEDGEFRFRRFGGLVGVAVGEVMRLFPEEIAPVRGRTPVRFVQRVAPDLLEVSVRSGYHRVRLVGLEPVQGTWSGDSPWSQVERGAIVYLEFDRQRYDAEGNWLAYVFLPSGRMLNAELIRLGLARPAPDERNVRYADLLHEMSNGGVPAAAPPPDDEE